MTSSRSPTARPPCRQPFVARHSEKRSSAVGKDMKYGVMIYETAIEHKGKAYEIVVAEDGTLVEKVLVVKDEEITLDRCPSAVKASLHEYGKGGSIGDDHPIHRDRPAYVRSRSQDRGQRLPGRGLRKRELDLQVARGSRGMMIDLADRQGDVQLLDRIHHVAAPADGPWCNSPGCRAAC